MKWTGVVLLIALIAVIIITSECFVFSQDSERLGQVDAVNTATGEIIVKSPNAMKIKMGDTLYVRVEGEPVLMDAAFPMQTVVKCRIKAGQGKFLGSIASGMIVYRYTAAMDLYARALEKVDVDPPKALAFALKAMKIDPKNPAVLNVTAYSYTQMGDPSKADPYYAMAKKELADSGKTSSAEYSHLLQNMAMNEAYRGDVNKALELAFESKELWEKLGKKETAHYATILLILAGNYNILGSKSPNELGKALQYFTAAKDLIEKIGLKKSNLYGLTLSNMGVYYRNARDYNSAMKYAADAMGLWEKMGLQRSFGYVDTISLMGNIHFDKGEHQASLARAKDALARFDQMGMQKSRNYCGPLLCAASASWSMGKYCEAVPYVEEAVDILTSMGHKDAPMLTNVAFEFRKKCGK